MPDFLSLLEKFGWPGAILVVIIIFLRQISMWLGEKIITPVANAHIGLVEEIKNNTKSNTEVLRAIPDTLKALGTKQDRVIELTEETNQILKEK